MSKNIKKNFIQQTPSKIIGIQFSILSPEEIRKGSVAEITSRDTYVNNKPVIGGLFDPRMGVLEPKFICPTDGLDYMQTPGYFGHIELARPVFYIQYMKTITKILSCVCFKCSKLKINKNNHKHILAFSEEKRWNYVYKLASKITSCGQDISDGCGCLQPKIKSEPLATINASWKDMDVNVNALKLTPEIVLKIFKRITDEDVHFMGFSPIWSRPDWMICQVMMVPPPAVRPSIKHDSQQRSEDDLTHILVSIIKANKSLLEKIQKNAPANIIDEHLTVLQFYIATQIDNKLPGVGQFAQRSGRPLKSIKDRLNGKGGRMRGNLMAKRVDFSARSVITADPNISIRELGVPLKIAKNITKPILVNDRNKEFLYQLILNGPDVYPGAKILEKKNKESITLRYMDRKNIVLENGDTVHRHMMDGDYILFNRQPTLHRMSMMGHVVKIMTKGDTFRMNVADTKCYNADFDGDEMNLHMPQNIEAETELKYLACVMNQIISPGNNKSIINIFQDSMLGCNRFTRENVKFSKRDAMNLLMTFKEINIGELFKNNKSFITSFEILSQIMPPLSISYKTKLFKDKEDPKTSNNILEIKNGVYIRGQLDKGSLDGYTKGLVQRVCNDFGNLASANFIDNLQNIVNEYMKTASYSVGISDLICDSKTKKEIIMKITDKKNQVKTLMDQIQLGIFKNESGQTNDKEFEMQVNNILNQASSEAGKIGLENLDKNNRFVIMVNAGSKGSDLNISQMTACLGQQNVDGKRIPYGFEQRTLPHYTKFDDSPGARGFVESSYINGLSPQELFFHAMGGRVGLIDTAVKSVTWETPIIIIQKGQPLYTEIGKWIDCQLDEPTNSLDIQHFVERRMELLDLKEGDVFIPTTDENGIVTWGAVTAITRHDPGTELYEIKTSGGRSVIVTESKSLLIWNETTQKLVETLTPEIKIGDCVPVTETLCVPPVILEYVDMEKYGESFELNEANGIKIGMFLANNQNSSLKILMELTKNGSCVPDEAMISSDAFIVGLLNGYFTENSIIDDKSIQASSVHKRLLEGISMLCSRLNIYCEISKNLELNHFSLSIMHQWIKIFREKIVLMNDNKNKKIRNIEIFESLKTINDIVLDPIVEINIIGVENHPKVYDLTIPSTLNFGLANGLQVRDTSTTGYIQRRLIKGLEDLMVQYDMTVRNNKNKIIQFVYGDDGIDPTKIENQVIPIVTMSIQDIYSHYCVPDETTAKKSLTSVFEKNTLKRYKNQMKESNNKCETFVNFMMKQRKKIVTNVFKNKSDSVVNCPVAFMYIISNIQGQQQIQSNSLTDITLLEAFNMIENTFQEMERYHYVKPNELFKTLYYYYLSPKDLLIMKRFNKKALELLLSTVTLMYKRAIVAPGEMVGMIAGQSIGEISTQMTLNTFHFAGVSAKSNVTRGVPRIEEILSLSSEPKNPSLTIYMKQEVESDKEKTQNVMHMIEHTKLGNLIKYIEICFDPDDMNTLIESDKLLIEQYLAFENMVSECITDTLNNNGDTKSKWVLRMEMNPTIMLEKNITMDDVHFALNSAYGDSISCIYSDYNSDKLIFRVRMNTVINQSKKPKIQSLDQSDQIYLLKNFQNDLLENTILRGVKGIDGVSMRKIKDNMVEKGGMFQKEDIWVLDTVGTNLINVLGLDFIESTRVFSNNIMEVYSVLGIEAARQTIYTELAEVIEFDGTYINAHHFGILCDRMTASNKLVSMFRHGINNDNIGPIAKASFEETPEQFLKAARHGELDTMRGISANVMCGQTGYFGTSSFQLFLDMEEMQNMKEAVIYEKENVGQEIEKLFELNSNKNGGVCDIKNFIIENNVVNVPILDSGMDDNYNPGF